MSQRTPTIPYRDDLLLSLKEPPEEFGAEPLDAGKGQADEEPNGHT
jgi:hypothetical protein